MKKNIFVRSILYLFFLILLFILYLFLYIFPVLKTINSYRVQARDFQIRLKDLQKSGGEFVYPDKKEKRVLKKINNEFERSIPFFKIIDLRKKYLSVVEEELKLISEKIGIKGIEIVIGEKTRDKFEKADSFMPENFINESYTIKSELLKLTFSTSKLNFIQFIRELNLIGRSLFIMKLEGKTDGENITAKIDAVVFFRVKVDHIKKNHSDGFLDFNSPLLSTRVYENSPERVKR